jgi:hypothetical protein
MNEKKVKETTENIVEAFVSLSLGKEPSLLSSSIIKSLSSHPNFQQMKQLIVEHLVAFDGKLETADEWKKLNDSRFKLVELHSKG